MNAQTVETFLERGAVSVPFPVSGYYLACSAIVGFRQFLKNEGEKEKWTIDVQGHGDPDDGYIEREGEMNHDANERPYDRKHFFHYRPELLELLSDAGVDIALHTMWLQTCGKIHQICLNTVAAFVDMLDQEYPECDFKKRFDKASCQHTLRLLYYQRPRTPKGVIGKEHYDRCFLTLHIADSEPGLQIGASKELFKTEEGRGLLFPGKKAEKISWGNISALQHQIMGEEERNRWAVLFFSHADTLDLTTAI